MTVREVDYLIIGAGMAGLTCRHFLESDDVVLLDREPGRYKIGESVIPEHYNHPELARLLPKVHKLPSYSPKVGSLFLTDTHAASYPLPEKTHAAAMHVSRHEVEPLMMAEWGIDVSRERVTEVDIDSKTVATDRNTYKVEKQIIDCSGPAMVVARAVDDRKQLWPVYCTWTYFDVVDSDTDRYRQAMKDRDYRRFEFSACRLLPGSEEQPGWSPDRTTILTRVEEGVWVWQIPLFDSTLVSFGVVSRKGKISADELHALAASHHAPNYTLRARPLDDSGPYNRLHVRNQFAQIASKASTEDYILIADAYGFADPIYSVGTGLAVNKGRQVAQILNAGGWSKERSEAYNKEYAELIEGAVEAFDFWYDEKVLEDDGVAESVQRNFLVGSVFHLGLSHHLERIVDASKTGDDPDADPLPRRKGSFDPEAMVDKTVSVRALLGMDQGDGLEGWTLMGVYPTTAGLQLRWIREGKPELMIALWREEGEARVYKQFDSLAMAYSNLLEGPYPYDDETKALLETLSGHIEAQLDRWKALLP